MANIGYLQIIRKCNQRCLFCSNPDNNKLLSFKIGKKYITDFIKNNYEGVILTGGEPTLHPELADYIIFSKDKEIEPRIITNGQKTADIEYLKSLKDKGLSILHLSLHSINPKVQNFLSQNQDSFKNLIRTLYNARKLKLNVNINCVINKLNAVELDKFILFIIKKYPEIKHFVFNNLDPEMNRVQDNLFLIPRFKSFKFSLSKALYYLKKNNKTFRVERVPLCYMIDYAEFSTETRKIVKAEERTILFLDNRRKKKYDRQNFFEYNKFPVCENCSLNKICAGLYSCKYNDKNELIPQQKNPNKIIKRILGDGKKT